MIRYHEYNALLILLALFFVFPFLVLCENKFNFNSIDLGLKIYYVYENLELKGYAILDENNEYNVYSMNGGIINFGDISSLRDLKDNSLSRYDSTDFGVINGIYQESNGVLLWDDDLNEFWVLGQQIDCSYNTGRGKNDNKLPFGLYFSYVDSYIPHFDSYRIVTPDYQFKTYDIHGQVTSNGRVEYNINGDGFINVNIWEGNTFSLHYDGTFSDECVTINWKDNSSFKLHGAWKYGQLSKIHCDIEDFNCINSQIRSYYYSYIQSYTSSMYEKASSDYVYISLFLFNIIIFSFISFLLILFIVNYIINIINSVLSL
eukprot:TRINITY_DN13030_c0_g1_i1.p1 TRINITY_DN13030_c0_g1~~TRINITY_DN13030_c0_g1_i1.p1  ORF type:complete len:317 (+),score=25.76 TRINITY_DN13030_c0_g1_i1:35-985(+)